MMTARLGSRIGSPSKLSWIPPGAAVGWEGEWKEEQQLSDMPGGGQRQSPRLLSLNLHGRPPRAEPSRSPFHRGTRRGLGRTGTQPALLEELSGRARVMHGSSWLCAPLLSLSLPPHLSPPGSHLQGQTPTHKVHVSPPRPNCMHTRSMSSHLTAPSNLHTS